jgi:hypothetical protein
MIISGPMSIMIQQTGSILHKACGNTFTESYLPLWKKERIQHTTSIISTGRKYEEAAM